MAEVAQDGLHGGVKNEQSLASAGEAHLARVANDLLAGRMAEIGDEGLDSMLNNFEQLTGIDMVPPSENFMPIDGNTMGTGSSLFEPPAVSEPISSMALPASTIGNSQDATTAAVLQALLSHYQPKPQVAQSSPQFQTPRHVPRSAPSPVLMRHPVTGQSPLSMATAQTHLSPAGISQFQQQTLSSAAGLVSSPVAHTPLQNLLPGAAMTPPPTPNVVSTAAVQPPNDLLYQLLLQQAQSSIPSNPAMGSRLLETLDMRLSEAVLAQVNTLATLNSLKQATVNQLLSTVTPGATSPPSIPTSAPSPVSINGAPSPQSVASLSSPSSPPHCSPKPKIEPLPSPPPTKPESMSPVLAESSPAADVPSPLSQPPAQTPGGGKIRAKTPRRSSHNAIERRYRFSINDRIKELRERVGGSDKLQKSGVLQKALDHLDVMTKENSSLRKQNETLQQNQEKLMSHIAAMERRLAAVGMTALECHSLPPPTEASIFSQLLPNEAASVCSASPGSSSGFESMGDAHSPPSHTLHYQGANIVDMATIQQKMPSASRPGMADSTRALMCMMMMFCVALVPGGPAQFNSPWSSNGDYGNMHDGGRTLAGIDLGPGQNTLYWTWSTVIVWLAQFIFVLIGLTWVLVRGEPILVPSSAEAVKFNRHHQQAKQELARGAFDEAVKQLEFCLASTGRGLPTTTIGLWVSLVWQLFYSILIVTRTTNIVTWLVHIPRWLLGTSDIDGDPKEHLLQKSARQAALIYHKLHCLALTGHAQYSSSARLHIALSSLNLAKCARSTMDRPQLSEIYATVAMELRRALPWFLAGKVFSNMMLHRARAACHPPPPSLYCLLNVEAVKFLAGCEKEPSPLWAYPAAPGQPLAAVSRQLRKHLMKQTLYQLVIANQQDAALGKKDACSLSVAEVHANLTCFRQLCRLSSLPLEASVVQVARQSDAVSLWWCNVITVATLWLAGEDSDAAELYACIMQQPQDLRETQDLLPAAVLAAFISRKALLGKAPESRVLDLCNQAGRLLEQSVAHNKASNTTIQMPSTHQLVQLLCCDWLLSTRAAVWQDSSRMSGDELVEPEPASASALAGFNHDLAVLQRLAHTCATGVPQVFLYEATARFMAGANPLRTQHLLAQAGKLRLQHVITQTA